MTSDERRPPGSHEVRSEEPNGSQALIPYPYAYPDDEIDLVGVGVSLWRRWKLMLTVFLVCLGIGLLIAFLLPKKHQYTTTIQVGTHVVGNAVEPVEPPDSAAQKVQNGLLPEVIELYASKHHVDPRGLKFEVKNPQKTNLVVISGRSGERLGAAYRSIEKVAAQELVESELPITRVAKAKLDSELAQARARRNELANPQYKSLLQAQIVSLETFIKQAHHQQLQSSREARSASGAMTGLLLGSQVERAEKRLADLQQTLHVNLSNEIESAKAKMASLSTQIANLQQSKIVAGPLRSLDAVGLPRSVIVILGAVIGVILALLAAAGANYLAAVRRRLNASDAVSGR